MAFVVNAATPDQQVLETTLGKAEADLAASGLKPPAVVVLAACDAAASEALPGEELRGFLSALFMLGTRSVIASTVPVPDLESTRLMTELHRGLVAGLDSERALDAARAGLDADDASVVLSVAYAHFGEPTTFDAA